MTESFYASFSLSGSEAGPPHRKGNGPQGSLFAKQCPTQETLVYVALKSLSLPRDGFPSSCRWPGTGPLCPTGSPVGFVYPSSTHPQRTGTTLLCASSPLSHYMPGEVTWGLGPLSHSVAASSIHSQTAEKSSSYPRNLVPAQSCGVRVSHNTL